MPRERRNPSDAEKMAILRAHWPQGWKKAAILDFEGRYPREGYRRLAFMMLDQNVAAAREMAPAAGNQLAAGPT